MKTLNVSLIQQTCVTNKQANIDATEQAIREAAKVGAQLVVLQELFVTPYFCQDENLNKFDLAETIPGPTSNLLGQLAKELQIVIVGSLFEKRAKGIYHNTAVVFEKTGEIAGKYRKMHIPDDPGYYEKYYFTPGDLGFTPIDTSVGRLGVLVCWDQWYPEAARLMALAGADMLIYPTAIGWAPEESDEDHVRHRESWEIIQRGHAVANHLPVLVCNRVGFEADPTGHSQGQRFWGSSFVSGPQGEILAQASISNPEILSATLDLTKTEQLRQIWPFFRDRRIDAYQALTERFID